MNTSNILPGFKRGIAYLIDCCIILMYALLLFAITMSINNIWPFYNFLNDSYLLRHAVSFVTLTLPAVIYFVWMEHSEKKASIGKMVFKLEVTQKEREGSEWKNLFIRNGIKLFPWEIAHTTYQLNPDFFLTGEISNPGIIIGLSLSYGLLFIYMAMVFFRTDGRGFHDLLSDTFVVKKESKKYSL